MRGPRHGLQGRSVTLVGRFEGDRAPIRLAGRLSATQAQAGGTKAVPPDRLTVVDRESFPIEADRLFSLASGLLLVC
jgi:hypothetical protein